MSWRISLYRIPKSEATELREYTQEMYEADDGDDFFKRMEQDRIVYDVLTSIIAEDRDESYSTRFLKNKLEVESDIYFGSISKEQFINIIKRIRELNAKWYTDRKVVFKNNGEVELGDLWKDPEGFYLGTINAEEALKKNQQEWNHKMSKWSSVWTDDNKTSYPDINLDLNNKWLVSGSWSYEYAIFDMIHILKIFDWENDELICIGG